MKFLYSSHPRQYTTIYTIELHIQITWKYMGAGTCRYL